MNGNRGEGGFTETPSTPMEKPSKKHNNFWFKWELQNEIMDQIRDRIYEGKAITKNDIQMVLEKYHNETALTKRSKSKSNQRQHSSFNDFCWTLGVWILLNCGEYNHLCDFLVQMSGIQLQLKEESLLELTLVSIKANQLKEALERLETYIPLVPFGDNPILVGYAGLISYILWIREPSIARYRRSSIEFLQSSLQMNPYNSYFLIYLVELMNSNENDLEELASFLESINISLDNYFCLKTLYHTYRRLQKPMSTWTLLSYQLCITNPMIELEILLELSDTVYEFGEGSTGISLAQIVEVLATRIEHDKSNLLVWQRIMNWTNVLSYDDMQNIWRDRISFWPEFLALQNIPSNEMKLYHQRWIENVLAPLNDSFLAKNEESGSLASDEFLKDAERMT